MPSERHEPIALQTARDISLDVLLPANVLERYRLEQEARERGELDPDELDSDDYSGEGAAPGNEPEGEPVLAEDVRHFTWHYRALLHAAYLLIGGPLFERLSRLHDRIADDFKPSGPPESPVYESYAVQHVLSNVPVGLARETPYSVLAHLLQADPARTAFRELARALADSHHDLYRVLAATRTSGELERLRDGVKAHVRTSAPCLREGDRLLARLLAFEGEVYLAEAPYLLRGSDDEWLAYLQRVADRAQSSGEDAARARRERPAKLAHLSPKQRARLLQQRKRAEQGHSVEMTIVQHLKYGDSERFWLDFIVSAYAGEREGIAYLAGVPDGVTSRGESEPPPSDERRPSEPAGET